MRPELPRPTWTFRAMGEAALLLDAQPGTPETNPFVAALAALLEALPPPGVTALVLGISSLLIRFDPLATSPADVRATLDALLVDLEPRRATAQRIVTIPVVYGGEAGPDLADVAALRGVTPAAIIAEHCRVAYPVLMLGFAPGFPYIGPVSALLSVPRRATPRATVPAGSVALAAGLTGIYPARLPGGWHIIGRTPLQLFDPLRSPPALLAPGDGVRFEPQTQETQR